MAQKKYIISGGGTGGHIFPAIAIANELKLSNPDCDILFVGAEGRMEMEKVPQNGYKIVGLPIAGFQRGSIVKNISLPFKLLNSLYKAFKVLKSFKPTAVIGVGGYASGPLLKAANLLNIPTFIQEQNSYAGVTNKLLSQKAKQIFVAYDSMGQFFPANKLVLTGNPVRQDLIDLGSKRLEGYSYYQLNPNLKTIVVMGGSLGAKTMNEAMENSFELIKSKPDVQILWQVGKLYKEKFSNCETAKLPNVHLFEFLQKMDFAYAVADVVVARAGALTISEVCVAGLPTILVPSPHVAEDHQTKNAESLSKVHAAILVKDDLAKNTLLETAIKLIDNEQERNSLKQEILKLAKPNATKEIVEHISKI